MSGNNVLSRFTNDATLTAYAKYLATQEVPQRTTVQPTLEEQRMADERVRHLLREGAL